LRVETESWARLTEIVGMILQTPARRSLMNWLQRLFRTRRMEQQLDSELRFHFEAQVADKVRDGFAGG